MGNSNGIFRRCRTVAGTEGEKGGGVKIKLWWLMLAVFSLSRADTTYPIGDLNQDRRVDLADLAILGEHWLEDVGCSGIYCAEIDSLSGVTLSDFFLMASNWLADESRPLLFINEFAASNTSESGIADPQGEFDDWIEIYNAGDTAVDTAGMYLTDDLGSPTAWRFPEGRPAETTIPPHGYLIVWADGDVKDTPGLHASFSLRADGEEIGLYDGNGRRIDSLSFSSQQANHSYGRWPDGGSEWRFFSVPTPGAVNNGGYLGLVEDTQFSHKRGFYDAPFSLTLSCDTPGAAIYYTTNGSAPIENEVPTAAAVRYTGPISISSTACIRAAAIKTGWKPSNIDTQTYIFGASAAVRSMPLISIVGDPQKSLYEPDGVMAIVGGYYDSSGVWQSSGAGSYNNPLQRGRNYERLVSFEYMDLETGAAFQQDCGIRVHGSDYTRPRYTRGADWVTCWNGWPNWNSNKFSLNLWFRDEYEGGRLDYPLFPFIEADSFESIVLRAGHNDACTPFVKDEWARRLFCQMGHAQVTGIFVNLYINGVYRGYYNPTARGDKEFYQEWYDTEDEFDVITQAGVRDGDDLAWNALLSYANSRNLSNMADYEYVASRLDIPAFIDLLILQNYIGNFDWPGNNWDVHRRRTPDGKFAFSIWDAEGLAENWAFGDNGENLYKNSFEHFPSWTSPTGLNNLSWCPIAQLYRALRNNPEFRLAFADRVHRHFRNGGVLTQANLLSKWWEVFGEVSAVLPEKTAFPVRYVPDVFIPRREPYVLTSFANNNLFDTSFGYPIFQINGVYQHGGHAASGSILTIIQSTPSGTLYYTMDGTDPRRPASTQLVAQGFVVSDSAPKKVLVPTGDIGTAWRGSSEPFNDTGWTGGTGGVGYERQTGYESMIGIDVGAAMYNKNATCYIRIPFTVDGAALPYYTTLTLRVRYDDGFVAFLNGTEVKRMNAPASLIWNSAATANREASSAWDSFDISAYKSVLRAGTNILAIHGLNVSTTSSDFLISAELEAPSVYTTVPAGISPTAIAYTGGIPLTASAQVKARIRSSTGQWSVLNEAVYAVGPVAGNLRIAELMYHPIDPNEEFIELVNIGSEAINLNLVRFTKGISFTFGSQTLAAGERIVVVGNQAAFLQRYPSFSGRIAGEYTGRLDDAGETIRLEDAVGTVIQEFSYKDGWYPITDGEGFSLTVRNPAQTDLGMWSRKEGWRPSALAGGSPGTDDSGLVPDPGAIVINELLAHSHSGQPDWIELYNTTSQPIAIGGWFLSDAAGDEASIKKYEIPLGTIIPAGGYVVFYEDQHFGNPSAPGVHIPFALSEGGETAYLRSGVGGVPGGYEVSQSFGASNTGISFGRYAKSAMDGGIVFTAMSSPTPGAANAYPLVGPVVISEIQYHPSAANTGGEYLELRNISSQPVVLQDEVSTEISPGNFITELIPWRFDKGIDFVFPSGTTIPAGGILIVAENPTAFAAYYGSMPSGVQVFGPFANGTKLDNGGETVRLARPGDQEYGVERFWISAEEISYDDVSPWPTSADGGGYSLHRIHPSQYGDDVINWQAGLPAPGN
ncbi:MAG TPA: lamin tail domain-containing protein [Anaerohalosphaeraceae bacterium]|nr:lamin tail domain-containing protein [Anaerohalosphaeraceae bacterium]HPP56700.1 lamin tail domain-containing protein [Anaerohalosphaeraceae bacterium]